MRTRILEHLEMLYPDAAMIQLESKTLNSITAINAETMDEMSFNDVPIDIQASVTGMIAMSGMFSHFTARLKDFCEQADETLTGLAKDIIGSRTRCLMVYKEHVDSVNCEDPVPGFNTGYMLICDMTQVYLENSPELTMNTMPFPMLRLCRYVQNDDGKCSITKTIFEGELEQAIVSPIIAIGSTGVKYKFTDEFMKEDEEE